MRAGPPRRPRRRPRGRHAEGRSGGPSVGRPEPPQRRSPSPADPAPARRPPIPLRRPGARRFAAFCRMTGSNWRTKPDVGPPQDANPLIPCPFPGSFGRSGPGWGAAWKIITCGACSCRPCRTSACAGQARPPAAASGAGQPHRAARGRAGHGQAPCLETANPNILAEHRNLSKRRVLEVAASATGCSDREVSPQRRGGRREVRVVEQDAAGSVPSERTACGSPHSLRLCGGRFHGRKQLAPSPAEGHSSGSSRQSWVGS